MQVTGRRAARDLPFYTALEPPKIGESDAGMDRIDPITMNQALFEITRPNGPGPGPVEAAALRQIHELTALGLITGAHAAICELAVTVARDIDASQGIGAPSGRAGLYKTMTDALAALPAPAAGETSTLARVLAIVEAE